MIKPIVEFRGDDWFIDLPSKELRAVASPSVIVAITSLTPDELDDLEESIKEKVGLYEDCSDMTRELYYEQWDVIERTGGWDADAKDIADKSVSK